jgi:hypothetical protein
VQSGSPFAQKLLDGGDLVGCLFSREQKIKRVGFRFFELPSSRNSTKRQRRMRSARLRNSPT